MRYVLHAWDGPTPQTDEESDRIFERLNLLPARPSVRLDDFVARLHARFPAFGTTPDPVWLDGSLDAAPRGPILAFGVQLRHLGAVMAAVVEQAAATGVVIYDAQSGRVFTPDGWVVSPAGRVRVEELMRPAPDDADVRRVLEGPAATAGSRPYRLHLFYLQMHDYDDCQRLVDWAATQADPAAWRADQFAQARSGSRTVRYEQYGGNPHAVDFVKMTCFARRVNERLRADGAPLPWADGVELDEHAPRLVTTLDVRPDRIAAAWPLILAEAARQGLVVHDPRQGLQAMPIGSFKIGDDWHGAGDDGGDALEYDVAHAVPLVMEPLARQLQALGFAPEAFKWPSLRKFTRRHGDMLQSLDVYVDKQGAGIGVSCQVTLDLPAADLPHLAWVQTAHGKPWPVGPNAPLLALAGAADRLPFRASQDKFTFYRAAHAAELVRMLVALLSDELMPLLDGLDGAPALLAALRAPSRARPWPDRWPEHVTYLSHLIGSAEADALLAQERARLQVWEGDPQASDYPGPWDVKSRRDRLDRMLAMRQGERG